MAVQTRPAVVWIPNLEIIQLLVNLTEEGTRYRSRAANPLRRAAWLRYDTSRRVPAVLATARLLRDGFWLDSLTELALAADALPKVGFSYPLSRETVLRAGGHDEEDSLAGLKRYLEEAALFTRDAEPLEFLRTHGDEYRNAVSELEGALAEMNGLGSLEQYFGIEHRSYLCVASLLMPAGLSFGLSLSTPEGLLAFHVAGPFIETDGNITFSSPLQAVASVEREFIRAFVKPVVSRGQLAADRFAGVFRDAKAAFSSMGYQEPLACLEDHLVYAVQSRLLARRGELGAAEALLKFDEESGYAFIRQFAESLEDYELHRTDFPDFEAYFPHMMDSFRGL